MKNYTATLSQPRAMYLLIAVQMWESFSYFGMRAILVLYMITHLQFTDVQAFSIFAIYIGLVEGLGIFGGQIADKIFGLRNAIYIGGVVIACGHGLMAFPYGEHALYLGLAAISVGTGLFRTSCTALLGEFYGEDDLRRDAGFTYFYVGLNLGAFLATIVCVYIAEAYGWHYGFSLAGFGMLFGLWTLFQFRNILEGKGGGGQALNLKLLTQTAGVVVVAVCAIAVAIYHYEYTLYGLFVMILIMFVKVYGAGYGLPAQQRENVNLIIFSVLLMAAFYAFEEQIASSLVVFADRFSDKAIFGFAVDAAQITAVNPITVLLLGPVIAWLLEKYEIKIRKPLNIFTKIGLAFGLQAAAFAMLYLYSVGVKEIEMEVIAIVFAIIAFSELFIGPAVYSYCSALAPKHMKGMMMGAVMLGFSLANVSSGFISNMMAIEQGAEQLISVYTDGFIKIAIACGVISIIIFIFKGVYVGHKVYKRKQSA